MLVAFNLQLLGFLLRSINMVNIWPVCVYQLDSEALHKTPAILPSKPRSYIILIEPEEERLIDSLISQLTNFSSDVYFNRRARFIIVVTGYRSEISVLLHDGCSMLWIDFKIDNFVIVAAKPE
jgi:hypothetical protein